MARLQLVFQAEPLFRIVTLAISEASEALEHAHLRVRSKLNGTLNALVGDGNLVAHINRHLFGGLGV